MNTENLYNELPEELYLLEEDEIKKIITEVLSLIPTTDLSERLPFDPVNGIADVLVNRRKTLRKSSDKPKTRREIEAFNGTNSCHWYHEQLTIPQIIDDVLDRGHSVAAGKTKENVRSRRTRDSLIGSYLRLKDVDEFENDWDMPFPTDIDNYYNEYLSDNPFQQYLTGLTESIGSRENNEGARFRGIIGFGCFLFDDEMEMVETYVIDNLVGAAKKRAMVKCAFGSAKLGTQSRFYGNVIPVAKLQEILDKGRIENIKRKVENEIRKVFREREKEGRIIIKGDDDTKPDVNNYSEGYYLNVWEDFNTRINPKDYLSSKGDTPLNYTSTDRWEAWERSGKDEGTVSFGISEYNGYWYINNFSSNMEFPVAIDKPIPFIRFYCWKEFGINPDISDWNKQAYKSLVEAGFGGEKVRYFAKKRDITQLAPAQRKGIKKYFKPSKVKIPSETAVVTSLEEGEKALREFFPEIAIKRNNIFVLKAPTGIGKNFILEDTILEWVRDGKFTHYIQTPLTIELLNEQEERYKEKGIKAFPYRARNYRWTDEYRELPLADRKLDGGRVCIDADRCNEFAEKGGNPNVSICGQCTIKSECEEVGYRSQMKRFQEEEYRILLIAFQSLFTNKSAGHFIEAVLDTKDNPLQKNLGIVDEPNLINFYPVERCSIEQLKVWIADWKEEPLGLFAQDLLDIITTFKEGDLLAILKGLMAHYEEYEEEICQAMSVIKFEGEFLSEPIKIGDNYCSMHAFKLKDGTMHHIPTDADAKITLEANRYKILTLPEDFQIAYGPDVIKRELEGAVGCGLYDISQIKRFKRVSAMNSNLFTQLKWFVKRYTRYENAPLQWNEKHGIKFYTKPKLHKNINKLLLMSATIDETQSRRTFDNKAVVFNQVPDTEWLKGNKCYQLSTANLPKASLLQRSDDGKYFALSKLGEFYVGKLRSLIENTDKKVCIITTKDTKNLIEEDFETLPNLTGIINYGATMGLDQISEQTDIFVLLGIYEPNRKIIKRDAKIFFGEDEEVIKAEYDERDEDGNYLDHRVQNIYSNLVKEEMVQAAGRARLNRKKGKTLIILSAHYLPVYTEKAQLFNSWIWNYCTNFEQLEGIIKETEKWETEEKEEKKKAINDLENGTVTMKEMKEKHQNLSGEELKRIAKANPKKTTEQKLLEVYQLEPERIFTTKELNELVKTSKLSLFNKKLIEKGKIRKVSHGKYQLMV